MPFKDVPTWYVSTTRLFPDLRDEPVFARIVTKGIVERERQAHNEARSGRGRRDQCGRARSMKEGLILKLLSSALALALGTLVCAPATAGGPQINVTTRNFAFAPATITLKLHQRTKLHFVSTQGLHGITIPELGINKVVTIGPKPTVITVTPGRTGTFVAHCAVMCGAGHADMLLTVKVVK